MVNSTKGDHFEFNHLPRRAMTNVLTCDTQSPYDGEEIWPEKQWQWEYTRTMTALPNDELVIAKKGGKWSMNYKQYLKDESGTVRGAKPFSILEGPYTQFGTAELARLSGDYKVFPFSKPSAVIARFIQYAHPSKNFIVLDFFAGSGSTFEAVLRLNKADSGRRRFISVQVPEPTGRDDFATIADITKERTRRVGTELKAEDGLVIGDVGFRALKLDTSNIRAWTPDRDDIEATLLDNVEHIRAGRSEEDITWSPSG